MYDFDTTLLLSEFIVEPQPSADSIKNQIEDWVAYNLKTTTASNPHYENSLYGPWNTLLQSIFPLRRRYMIKPQCILRRIVDPGVLDEDNRSIGSYGGEHESRNLPGGEIEKRFPDFVASKVILKKKDDKQVPQEDNEAEDNKDEDDEDEDDKDDEGEDDEGEDDEDEDDEAEDDESEDDEAEDDESEDDKAEDEQTEDEQAEDEQAEDDQTDDGQTDGDQTEDVNAQVPRVGDRLHVILCIVEIKRDNRTIFDAHSQMMKYMDRGNAQPSHAEHLTGYLVMQNLIQKYYIDDNGNVQHDEPYDLFTVAGRALVMELCTISAEYWNKY